MQTVLTNDMVAHVWAQQRQQSGKSGNGQFYFEGRTLYSYGSHFPVGIFIAPGGPVFLNGDSYSMTTGRHQSRAWEAVRHIPQRFSLPALGTLANMLRLLAGGMAISRADVAAYLESNWAKVPADSEGAAYLLKAARYRGTWAAMRARLAGKADAARMADAARAKAAAIREGRKLAAESLAYTRESAWILADYRQSGLRGAIADLRAARLATPKAHKRVRAALWQREQISRRILATAETFADRSGNPGDRAKAHRALAMLARFRAGRVGYVPGYEGPETGPDKLQAALDLPTGAGWRAIADLLRDVLDSPAVHAPPAIRAAATALRAEADAIATEREGEETQRREVRDSRRRVRTELQTFNRERRTYREAVASGAWAGGPRLRADGVELARLDDRNRARVLDSIIAHVPAACPWGTARGFELRPDLASRAARIAARAAELAAELEPVRDSLRTEWERAEASRRAAERAEEARLAAMSPDEKAAAWRAGELSDYAVRNMPVMLRADAAEVAACQVTAGELVTSHGARVPLRHAVRVFAFARQCRETGQAWEAGKSRPAAIRVGHFTVDSIDSTGSFRAGCHAIDWAEVERLARELGVWACEGAALMAEESAV